jgi:hypothetical protein
MTVVTIGQGFLAMEAPEPCLELYGTNDKSLGTQFCSRIMGASILSIGVTALCLFTMNLDAKKAIGWSLIVWIVEHARALVNQVPSKIEYDPAGQSLWLVLNILCVYACFTEAAYTDSLLFTLFGIWAVNCVVAVVAPRTAASVYAQDHDKSFLNFDQVCWTQGYGHAGLAHCVFALSLLKGIDPHRAMGLMSVSVLVQCAHILLGPHDAGTVGNFMTAGLLVFHFPWICLGQKPFLLNDQSNPGT